MFIAMNRFKVKLGEEDRFERVWKERDTHLRGVEGFVEFHLLRGQSDEQQTLFASHSVWVSRTVFEAWTRSDAFREAHRAAGEHRDLYLGPPQFEGFEVVQTLAP